MGQRHNGGRQARQVMAVSQVRSLEAWGFPDGRKEAQEV